MTTMTPPVLILRSLKEQLLHVAETLESVTAMLTPAAVADAPTADAPTPKPQAAQAPDKPAPTPQKSAAKPALGRYQHLYHDDLTDEDKSWAAARASYIRKHKLRASSIAVLAEVSRYSVPANVTVISRRLKDRYGISVKATSNQLKKLTDAGLLTRTGRGFYKYG